MTGVLEIFLAIILLSVLFSLSSSRLMTLIKLMAIQGALVSLTPVFLGTEAMLSNEGLFLFLSTLVVKAVVIPTLLWFALTRIAIKREIEPLIGYHASVAAGLCLILAAGFIAQALESLAQDIPSMVLITAITTLGGGLFLMMSRTKAISQVIGYLMLENGIYLMGTALAARQTRSLYLIEFGVLLDLLVGVMIMGIILNNISRAFDDMDTTYLEQLKD
ncbi:MAG: hydrogenase [Desulfobulbus sp.]|jgi:hydrogenase-4 component E